MRIISLIFTLFFFTTPTVASARIDTIFYDDTNAIRKALYESDQKGKILYFPLGYHFRVTGTLNYYNKEYQSYTLNMLGCIPIKQSSYVPKEYGGIAVEKGVSYWNLYVY